MHAHAQSAFLSFSPVVSLPILIIAIGRPHRWLPVRKFESCSKIRKPAALIAGMGVVWIVSASRWSGLDHCLLTFHMVRHLLLMMVAAPLILSGVSMSREPSDHRSALLGFISHPALCWSAASAAVIAWHLPSFFELALHSASWHIFEDGSFLAAGLLFWLPVIEAWRNTENEVGWFVPLYLFLATIPCDILSAFLVFCGRVVYPSYRLAGQSFGFAAFEDQEFAGALMWVTVTFAYLIPAAVITIRKLSPSPTSVQWKGSEQDERPVSLRHHPVTEGIASQVEGF